MTHSASDKLIRAPRQSSHRLGVRSKTRSKRKATDRSLIVGATDWSPLHYFLGDCTVYKRLWAWPLLLILLVGACGRLLSHATPARQPPSRGHGPSTTTAPSPTPLTAWSIELKPMTDAELNRLAPGPDLSNNPLYLWRVDGPG